MVVCAGTLAPAVASPAEELHRLLSSGDGLEKLDGAFAAAYFNAERDELTLIRDLDLPITRAMTQKQFGTYLDRVFEQHAAKGYELTQPEIAEWR